MNLNTFFEKFDQFAEAPNAVGKMRELILQLAVQGKLVEQNPEDGTATDLIERSTNERNRFVKEKWIRNSQPIAPVSEFNIAGPLPKSWAWTTLAEIAVINPHNDCEDDILATFIPMPGIPQNYRGALGEEVRPWGEIKKSFTHFADGDIALAKITPCFQNGKSAVFRGLKNGIGAGTTELHVARPIGSPVVPEYVWIFLKTPLFVAEGIPVMTGSAGQKRVPTGYFALKPFPLPPLAEQKRIVAKVDKLMALCDHLETQQRERDTRHAALVRTSLAHFADAPTPANLNLLFHPSYTIAPADLRKTILTLAVQGKLVPQDANESEAGWRLTELYQTKVSIAKAGKLKASKVPGSAWLAGSQLSIPSSWQTVGFDHLAVPDNHALKAGPFGSALKKEFYVPKGYKIYGQEQVIGGNPFFGDYYINERKFAELESCAVAPGDILISLVGTIGKVLVLPDGIEPGIINPRLIKLSLDPSLVYPQFIKILLGSPYALEFFDEKSHGGTMSILNLSILRELPIPLPPLAEQRRIVAKVDLIMALVDQLETQLTASRAAATNLMEAVVTGLTEQE